MTKWTSCQYDDAQHLSHCISVEGGFNPRQQATRRSHEYEISHKGCAAVEVPGGVENCPIDLMAQVADEYHSCRGK